MKFRIAFLAAVLTPILLYSQSADEQINDDIWYPFVYAYSNFDADSFMSVHTKDVVRVARDGRSIQVGDEYAKSVQSRCKWGIENEAKRSIEFTFAERIHGADSGFEVGYYRVHFSQGDSEQVFYGKFQVVLKKVDGKWKIAVDSDTSQGGAVGEEDFNSGTPLPPRD